LPCCAHRADGDGVVVGISWLGVCHGAQKV
jgi:hypothetical protein